MIGVNINEIKNNSPIVINISDGNSLIYDDFDNLFPSQVIYARCDNNIKNEYKNINVTNISEASSTIYEIPTNSQINTLVSDICATTYVKSSECTYTPNSFMSAIGPQRCNFNIVKSSKIKGISKVDSAEIVVKQAIRVIKNPNYTSYIDPATCLNAQITKTKNRNYDSIHMNVTSVVESNDVFYKNNRDIINDINLDRLQIGNNIKEFEVATINLDNKKSEVGNVTVKGVSMLVSGEYVAPDQESEYVPDTSTDYGSGIGLTSINFRCQRDSYFEIALIMGQEIKNVIDLPDGVTFDGTKIKGALKKAGDFNSIIELSSGKIEVIFKVDSITRIM